VLDSAEETVEIIPVDIQAIGLRVTGLSFVCIAGERSRRRPAVAADLRSNPLHYFPQSASINEPKLVRVGMNVYEPWSQGLARTINDGASVAIGTIADHDNAAVDQRNVGGERCGSAAVIYPGSAENSVQQSV
jgi:hypothetical protein